MSNYSFENYSLQILVETTTNWILYHIVYPIEAYVLPVLVVLTIVNNVLVLIIFITSKDVTKHLKQSIRIYYIATAVGDAFVPIPFHFTYFLGTHLLFRITLTN